jgi:tetratricopeptide (TPR) repeat protein
VQLLRDNKQYLDAYSVLASAAKDFPTDTDLAYDLAMAAEKIGKVEEMEKLLRQVIAAKPDYHNAYNALGYSLAERNTRLTEARALVAKALEFAPNDPYIVDSMAWVEFRSGNKQEALRLLQGAFKARPDAEIAAHLGEVLWSLEQQGQAKSIWKEGLALNPDNETLKETIQRLSKP